MRGEATMLATVLLANALMCGCGGGNGGGGVSPAPPPTISTTAAQNGAMIVSLASATSGAAIYYTVDGSTPSTSSQQYQAPFLVASNLTLKKAIATAAGKTGSTVTSQSFAPNIQSGWSGATSSLTPQAPRRSPIPNSGPTTPATAALATTSWRTTVLGARPPLRAAQRIPAHSWAQTAICISRHSNPRPGCTHRRG